MNATLITIIVDRVGNTNVFNVIHEPTEGSGAFLPENQSLHSITDDDLIEEYLEELERISHLSRSTFSAGGGGESGMFDHLDLKKQLHQVGETFFRQFFPQALQELFLKNKNLSLYFHIDPKLASIPLEILSNGQHFLWEKFYIGKNIKGQRVSQDNSLPKENLKMLIIADPTEDLQWARREGENLYDYLNTNFPEQKLQIQLIAGRNISKLSLLNDLVDKDLIHYSGHLHYTNDLQENGWILYDNKIIHAREIQQSGAKPQLIFSNSCISGRDKKLNESVSSWYENFASSFLKSGRTNYIGSIWELPDNEQTLKFTLQFYDLLFRGEEVGVSLHKARAFAKESFAASDLTWASYLLMGNPRSKIFQSSSKVPDLSGNILNPEIVLQKYPFPVARAYEEFFIVDQKEEEKSTRELLGLLFQVFEQTVLFLAAVIFANYRYLNITKPLLFKPGNLHELTEGLYMALRAIKVLKVDPLLGPISEVMFFHKDEITKILDWHVQFQEDKLAKESIEGYCVSLQYLMERMLMDMEFIKNYGLYRIHEPGVTHLSLKGCAKHHRLKEILLPTQRDSEIREELVSKSAQYTGKCVFYIPLKRIFLDLSPFLDINIISSDKEEMEYELSYHAEVQKNSGKKSIEKESHPHLN